MIKIRVPVPPPAPEEWELVLRRTTPEYAHQGYNQFAAAQFQGGSSVSYPTRAVTPDDLVTVLLALSDEDWAIVEAGVKSRSA